MAAHAKNLTIEAVDRLPAPTEHKPLLSDEKLKQLYAEMQRVRQHRNMRSKNRTRKQGWTFQEAPIVGCTIDLRAEDSLIASADLPSSTIAKRSVLDADSVVALATGAALLHGVQARGSLVVVFVESKHIARNRHFLRFAHMQSLPIIYVQLEKASFKTSRNQTGMIAIPVDKADVVAIYRVASEAIDKARRGAGPTLIQCVPFSLKKVSANHHSHDPIRYMEYYLRKRISGNEQQNRRR